MNTAERRRAPAVFVSHGSPMVAIEEGPYQEALRDFARQLPPPRAVVVVSAHWKRSGPIRVSRQERTTLIYDFGGFPRPLYELTYPAPGDMALADRIVTVLEQRGFEAVAEDRGLDHGAWVPLRLMFPEAHLPVVQVSLPWAPADTLVELGAALAGLRSEGLLVLGSGGITHNLDEVDFQNPRAPAAEWARGFDQWVHERVAARDWRSLCRYQTLAPHAWRAVPTPEHFEPVLVTVGAALEHERASTIYEGFDYATLSMRCFAFGVEP